MSRLWSINPLLPAAGLAAVVWLFVLGRMWHRRERREPGWTLVALLWGMTAWTCVVSMGPRTGWVPPSDASSFAGVGVMGAALLGARGRRSRIVRAVIAYGGVLVVSGLILGQEFDAPVEFACVLLLPLAAWLTGASELGPEQLVRVVRRIATAVVVASIAAWMLVPSWAATLGPGAHRRWQVLGLGDRVAGVTPHPNLLGITAGICLLATVHQRPKHWRLVVAACLLAVVLGEARGAAGGTVAAAGLLWLLSGRHSTPKVLTAIPVVIGATLFLLTGGLDQAYNSDLGSDASKLNSRTVVWEEVRDAWGEQPVIGWGPLAFDTRTGTPLSDTAFLTSHNQAMQSIAEGGVLGLVAFGLILRALGRVARRRQPFYAAVALLLGITMFTETPLTVHPFNLTYTFPLAWFFVVLVVAGERAIAQRRVRYLATQPVLPVPDSLT